MPQLNWSKNKNGNYYAENEALQLSLFIEVDEDGGDTFVWTIEGLPFGPSTHLDDEDRYGCEETLEKAMLAAEAAIPDEEELEWLREETEREWRDSYYDYDDDEDDDDGRECPPDSLRA